MERKLEILMSVVDEYIGSGEPVGSKVIAERLGNRVSSATIRNEMAALCELGYLFQPHTSAGRIPTLKGYRAYIDALAMQGGSPSDVRRIDEAADAVRNSGKPGDDAAKALSELTGCTTLAAAETADDPITCIEVIPHGSGLYTVLAATGSGKIKTAAVHAETPVSPEAVALFVRRARELFCGLSASQLTPALLQSMAGRLDEYFMRLAPFLGGLHEAVLALSDGEISLYGEKALLQHPDYGAEQLRALMSLLEDRALLLRLLDIAGERVTVALGPDSPIRQLADSALLTVRYGDGLRLAGRLGIIAPLRANYRSIIPEIEYFTARVGRLTDGTEDNKNNGREH